MDETNARLVATMSAGDEQAFLGFYREVDGPLRGLIRRFVSDPSVNDLVQETWTRALESLEQFQGHARLSTWVLQIGLNLARTSVHRQQREVSLTEGLDPDDGCFTTVGNWLVPPPAWPASLHDPEQLASNRELLRHLEAEIRTLPDAWRAAVVLCDVEGLTPRDAAAVMEVTDGNLRVLLHRGRARLRQSIEAMLQNAP